MKARIAMIFVGWLALLLGLRLNAWVFDVATWPMIERMYNATIGYCAAIYVMWLEKKP